jgi:hypothetical protein
MTASDASAIAAKLGVTAKLGVRSFIAPGQQTFAENRLWTAAGVIAVTGGGRGAVMSVEDRARRGRGERPCRSSPEP